MMRLSVATLVCVVAATGICTAQERPNTILVMDGSGSMWGQIEGVAKITIAQEVVQGLLADFPSEQGLGLTVYGHRQRGECTDIETVVAPAPGTAEQIAQAVNAIKPLGKTPMTDAVIAAAEALRYTEDKATVILVSDGVETCNPDPCAAARLLEEAGIGFTAHVIGFDVGSDAEALAQMQCIADETGGQFLTADTADQLTDALTQVAVAEPEPKPEMVPVTLTAVIEDTPDLVDGPVLWDIEDADGLVADDAEGNPFALDLAEGSYVATAYSAVLEDALSRQFIAFGESTSVEIAFPAPAETARLIAPAEAPAGSTIEVAWDGPAGAGDFVGIGAVDATGGNQWRNYTQVAQGNPLTLLMPPEAGPSLIRYFKGDSNASIGEVEIAATPLNVELIAPVEAVAGSEISVGWKGPDYSGDFIGIGRVGATGGALWENYTHTREGSPLLLTVPAEPGEYEITYFLDQDNTPATTVALTVTEVGASIIAPAEAVAGSTIEVGWTGPDYEGDFIGIGEVSATGAAQWENYVRTDQGTPIDLTVPAEPGDYVITYFARQDYTPLAQVALTVTEVGASIIAPVEAVAGSTIEVGWTGPDYEGDFIGIGEVSATGAAQWENYVRTDQGTPIDLTVPAEPGDYVITYFARQDYTPLAQVALTATVATASVSAPPDAVAGATIEVDWTGPDYEGDYIGIGPTGASGAKQWANWAATSDGSPASLLVPPVEGEYTITYFARQDRTALATTTLSVSPPEVSIVAPVEAVAGATVEIAWTGPNYDGDYIGIGLASESGAKRWENYAVTKDGSPAQLVVPPTPGDYLITYFNRQHRTPLFEVPIRVTPVSARLIAPPTAAAGQSVEIGWVGPDYKDDYIGIGRAGADGPRQWEAYRRTSTGNPVVIDLPSEPGAYVIRYFLRQGRIAVAEVPLIIE